MSRASRRSITLAKAADDALRKTGNASGYISDCILLRRAAWRSAYSLILDAGWSHSDLLDAYNLTDSGRALLGLEHAAGSLLSASLAQGLHLDMEDGERRRWVDTMTRVKSTPALAHALAVFIAECGINDEPYHLIQEKKCDE